MGRAVVHFEINGPDAEAAGRFYSELFGWHVQSMPEMGYVLVDTHSGGGINGGFGKSEDGATSSIVYVEVDDLDATLQKAGTLGGKTATPPLEIPNVVTFALLADPDGNVVGLVKSGPQQGPGVSPGSNPQVGWFEIYGKDATALWTFYRGLFDWNIKEQSGEGFVYGEVEAGEKGIGGGITSAPDGQARVILWAQVDDLTKYLERAESLGGKKVMDPRAVNDSMSVAQFADPHGRVFGLYTYAG